MGFLATSIIVLTFLIIVAMVILFYVYGTKFFNRLMALQVNILYYSSLQLAINEAIVKEIKGFKKDVESLETTVSILKQSIRKRPPS